MSCFNIIELKQGTPEWHSFRKNHIGASDAPVIMNKSPWKTQHALWREKLGLTENNVSSPAMKRGIELEAKAREKFCLTTGIEVAPIVAVSKPYEFMAASLDGIDKEYKEIVEIKCPGYEDHTIAKCGKIPPKYLYQLIQQMLVFGVDHIHYFSYSNDNDFALVTLDGKTVQEEMESLVESEKAFWECVQSLKEPDLCEQDFVHMNSVEWNLAVDEYFQLKKQMKEIEERESFYRNQLISMSQNKNCRGSGLRMTKVVRRGVVDYNSIPELTRVDLDKYRKPVVESWRFTEEKVSK